MVFVALVGVAYAAGESPNPRLLYLTLLFALCSTVVIDIDGLNGRHALLALFMAVYFVSFGIGDLSNLLPGTAVLGSRPTLPVSTLLSAAEAVILVGGTMLLIGYRVAEFMVGARRPSRTSGPKDWSKQAILIVGVIFWVIGTIATYRWYVYVVPDTTDEAYRRGLNSIGTVMASAYILGQMCQPLGMLLLVYAWTRFRNPYLMVIVVAVVAVQIFIGFVSDVKGVAMIGIILVIVTGTLVGGRLPKVWLAAGVIFVVLIYPYFTAYRTAIHGAGISRTAVVGNFGEILQKTMAAKDRVNTGRNRAQTFLERSNVKGSVEIIVEKAGNEVAFQRGYTLSPILQTFVPKIVWSDKLRIPTGQLFNKQFHIVEGDEVYISPSHLGELYWNFGWSGVVLGMTLIGLICGWVGAGYNLAEFKTVTRVLVTVITIRQLIVSFESSIADCYVGWLRLLAGIAILHLVFARVPLVSRLVSAANPGARRLSADERPSTERLFPNLLT